MDDAESRVYEELKLRDKEVISPVSGRDLINLVLNNSVLRPLRELVLKDDGQESKKTTVGSFLRELLGDKDEDVQEALDKEFGPTVTLGQILDLIHADKIIDSIRDTKLNQPITVGKLVDFVKNNEAIQNQKDRQITVKFTVGQVFDLIGEDNVRELLEKKTAEASRKEIYEKTPDNIAKNWMMLGVFVLAFALLSVIVLELIDKDKR